jgi:hypothetical protein
MFMIGDDHPPFAVKIIVGARFIRMHALSVFIRLG